MRCPGCGADVVEQAVFCHKCGERINPDAADFPSPADESSSPAERLRQGLTGQQDNGGDEEEGLWRGGYCSKAMIGAWIASGLITVALLGVAIWLGGWVWWAVLAAIAVLWVYQLGKLCYRRWSVRYQLTNQRFIHETGILRRVTDRIEVIDMDDIAFEQKLFERIVGVGTIRITSSDRTHPELVMAGIDEVKRIAGMMDDARRVERRRRGLHIESI